MAGSRIAASGALLFSLLAPAADAAPGLQAYALTAAGTSILQPPFGCATFGPDPRAAYFVSTFQVGLPTDGAICGVGVDSRQVVAPSGAAAAASILGVGWGTPGDPRAFLGSAAGRAGFGVVGARANASYSGSVDSMTVLGSQAFGLQTESMSFNGGAGAGWYQPTFTIDGSLFGVGRTYSQVAFMYSTNNGPHYLGFRMQFEYGALSFYGPGGYVSGFPGMTVSGDLATGFIVTGQTQFTLTLPMLFDTPADYTFGLWTSVLPSSSLGLLTPSAGNADFYASAQLTGIAVLAGNGQPLTDFSITSGSGTLYGPDGVIPSVPEPASFLLFVLGLAGLGWRGRAIRPGPAFG